MKTILFIIQLITKVKYYGLVLWNPTYSSFRETKCIPRLGSIFQKMGILLEVIFGDTYSITFGDGLVTLKPQPANSNLSLLMHHP